MTPSLKGRFAFRLATTSFIYPAGWAENVRRLAARVDEIELLFFESAPGSLPTADDIRELVRLGRDLAVGYNVHLPLDVSPGDADAARRREAVRRLAECLARCSSLAPSSYTLHLPAGRSPTDEARWSAWRHNCRRSIEALLDTGLNSRRLAVETLVHPPFERVQELVEEYDLGVCLDVGHLLICGRDPAAFFRRLARRIAVVHLHGVADGRDHLGLDCMPPRRRNGILELLTGFRGTVSLEVFSPSDLQASLQVLEQWRRSSSP